MHLCANCFNIGYCQKETTTLVSDHQIENPDFLKDLRAFTSELSVSPDKWIEFIADTYRDYRGRIVYKGQEVFLETEVLEVKSIREWFRDFICTPVRAGAKPRLREESRERIRLIATVLATRFPFEASTWGMRAANDNHPPNQPEQN